MVTVGVVVKPASYYVEQGIIALRSLNIKPNRIDLSDVVYFSPESNDGVLSKSRLKSNDVVIVRTGKTGTAAVVPVMLDGANCIDLIVVRPKTTKIHPQYLTCLLNSERGMALVSSLEVGGIQKHFNVGALNKIPFPLPPIELQGQFADIVGKIECIKSRYQQSLSDLEALYGALSQQAFKGALDLSGVPLPETSSEQEISHTVDDKTQQKPQKETPVENTFAGKSVNEDTFVQYLGTKGDTVFSGEEIYKEMSALGFANFPTSQEFKALLYQLLEMPNKVLTQVFDVTDLERATNRQPEPRIAFKVVKP